MVDKLWHILYIYGRQYKTHKENRCFEMLINTGNKSILIRLIELLKPCKRKISIISVCIITSSGISTLVQLLGMKITDDGLSVPNCNIVAVFSVSLSGLVFAVKGVDFIKSIYYSYISSIFPLTLSKTAFKLSFKPKISYFNNTNCAEIVNNIDKYIGNMSKFCDRALPG